MKKYIIENLIANKQHQAKLRKLLAFNECPYFTILFRAENHKESNRLPVPRPRLNLYALQTSKNVWWFYFSISTASSLKCYSCKGPDDGRPYPQSICENEEMEVTCTSQNNSLMACGKYHHEIKSGVLKHEVEARACIPEQDCYWIGMSCRAIILAGGECEYACCSEDLCNNVSLLTASKLLTAEAYVYGVVYLYKFTIGNLHWQRNSTMHEWLKSCFHALNDLFSKWSKGAKHKRMYNSVYWSVYRDSLSVKASSSYLIPVQ